MNQPFIDEDERISPNSTRPINLTSSTHTPTSKNNTTNNKRLNKFKLQKSKSLAIGEVLFQNTLSKDERKTEEVKDVETPNELRTKNKRLNKFKLQKSKSINIGQILLQNSLLNDESKQKDINQPEEILEDPEHENKDESILVQQRESYGSTIKKEAEEVKEILTKLEEKEGKTTKFNWEGKYDRVHLAEKLKDVYDDVKNIKKHKRRTWQEKLYKRTRFLRVIFMMVGLISMFVAKPSWCEELQDFDDKDLSNYSEKDVLNKKAWTYRNETILFKNGKKFDPRVSQNCSYSVEQKEDYYIKGIPYYSRFPVFLVQTGSLLLIVLSYLFKIQLYIDTKSRAFKILIKMSFLVGIIATHYLR